MTIRSALVLGLCLVVAPAAVFAKTFELPDGKPLVTLDLPNAWSPEEIDKGAQATSPDTSIYIAMEIEDAKDTSKAVAEAITFFREKGVKIDQASQRKNEGKINGLDVVNVEWDARDADGPTLVALSVFVLSPTKIGMLTFWGPQAGQRKYAAQLKSIMDSIQPLGR